MALYGHHEHCTGLLTICQNNPTEAQCQTCSNLFCTTCMQNVHFPTACHEMMNWKSRVDFGPGFFEGFKWSVDYWSHVDSLSLLVKEKKGSFDVQFISDHNLIGSVFDELYRVIHLMRWASVLVWHYPHPSNLFEHPLKTLNNAFDDLLKAVPTQEKLQYWWDVYKGHDGVTLGMCYTSMNGLRTNLSNAAIGVLSVVRLLRFTQRNQMLDAPIANEMERWRERISRM